MKRKPNTVLGHYAPSPRPTLFAALLIAVGLSCLAAPILVLIEMLWM